MTVNELYQALGSCEDGLDNDTVLRRQHQYGLNILSQLPTKPWFRKLLAQFTHFFALLLWLAALISFVIAWIDPASNMLPIGWAVLIIIILNGLFGFYQEYRTEKSLESLRRFLPLHVNVRRGGDEIQILAEELVPGDIVLLNEGDKIPADMYLIRAFDVWVNESTLSGESEPVSADSVETSHPKNILYSGTYLLKGEAEGLVFATAKDSRYGKIASLTQSVESGMSHLQREIGHISKMVALSSFIIMSVLLLIAGLEGFDIWKTVLFSLGILVALIPEGLLPTVTLALAFGAQRMAAKGFLVNGLSVIENLGAVTVIATDKTGTITQNRMKVTGWEEEGGDTSAPSTLLLEGAILCNRAVKENKDPVEQALIEFSMLYPHIQNQIDHFFLEADFPFDYHLKRMSTVHRDEGRFKINCKGAPEIILQLCHNRMTSEGIMPMDDESYSRLMKRHELMASQGYRIIAFASATTHSLPVSREEAEKNLVFLGFIALEDPLREDIAEAVDLCRKAGIRVLMLTGDHPSTAGAIGMKAGIIDTQDQVTTGDEIEKLPVSAIKHLLRRNHVFARVTPEQKLLLVEWLDEMGESVAVTGDGVNDAPALKRADVGIAMGSGTDVAKQAADVILMDDHFGTIVKGIAEGRAVYDNIRRFITYMLASNLPEAVPYVFFFWSGFPLALPVVLVLAIDLGTDIFPGLALGIEPPHTGLMHQKPRHKKERILTPGVYWRAFGFLGMMSAVFSMGIFWFYLHSHGWNGGLLHETDQLYREATTLAFATIVFAQIGNGLSCRSSKESLFTIGWWNNRFYWMSVLIALGLLGVLMFVPIISSIFSTAIFDPAYWIVLIGVTIMVLAAEEIRKWIIRAR